MTFELEEFFIDCKEEKSVLCEIDLAMTEPPDPGCPPSMNHPGDPPWPAEFEITHIKLTDVQSDEILTLNETQFSTFFENGQDVLNNAYEWAAKQEVEQ